MSILCKKRRFQEGFSLIEMFLAMGLLAFLMLVLFRFFANVQSAWTLSMNTTDLYENSRVVLDVITRDLQSAVARADDIPGQHIRFHQPAPDQLWFITAGEPTPAAHSSLMEVGYRLNDNCFERAFVDDSNTNWNVYGARDDADDQDGYHRVVDAVLAETFTCFDEQMVSYVPNTLTTETQLPAVISVTLVLMDSKSFKLWERLPTAQRPDLERKAARTFRKTIYLGGRGK